MPRPLTFTFLLLCLWAFSAPASRAASVTSVTTLERGSGASFVPWVMAVDKSDGDNNTNRHLIRCSADLNLDHDKYRIDFRLKKVGGAVVLTASYFADTTVISLGAYTYTHDFEPVAQLDPYGEYVVQVEIVPWDGNSYQAPQIPILRQSAAQRYLHFTNTVSNDAPLHVIGEATASNVTLTHTAAGYSLTCGLSSDFYRFDRFNEAFPASDFIDGSVVFTLTQVDSGANIPLQAATVALPGFIKLDGYAPGNPKAPSFASFFKAFTVTPTVAIDPTAHQYSLSAQLQVETANGALAAANSVADVPTKMAVDFPPGSGWAASARDCVLNPSLTFVLNAGDSEWQSTASDVWVMEESEPVLFLASKVYWNPATGAMRFAQGQALGARQQWLDDLELVKLNLTNANKELKRSNDHAFNGASATVGDVAIDSFGRLDATITLARKAFRTHFPYDVYLDPQQGGTVDIAKDSVSTVASHLDGVAVLTVPYSKLCWSCTDATDSNPSPLVLQPTNNKLTFTADGGLRGAGLVLNAVPLAWGRTPEVNVDAHAFDAGAVFDNAVFLMAGQRIAGTSAPDNLGPARLLLTGFKAAVNGTLTSERPGSAAYGAGDGDYAGMNFRCVTDGTFHATSNLAGSPFSHYPLAGDSKYVARFGGVTGRHNAVAMSPTAAQIYGFNATFTSFGMTFLDNANDHTAATPTSRIAGQITIPSPSNFSLPFERISFTCAGNVSEIVPPASFQGARLEYWHLPFTAGDVSFPLSDTCTVPGSVPLRMQVKVFAQQVPEPLFATVGFWQDGQLVRPYDGDASNPSKRDTHGITSRFPLPNVIRLGGPGVGAAQEFYSVEPVADAYLNHAGIDPNKKPEIGFFSIAGLMDVPFFQDMQVQVHLSSQEANVPFNSIMGGWPSAGFRDANDRHYFNDRNFDMKHEGFPVATTTIDDYRNGVSTNWQPHVVSSWLNSVTFNHPVKWNKFSRLFEARSDDQVQQVPVFVTDIDCSVPLLTPKRAEIKFGKTFGGLPQLSLANMAYNAVDDGRGLLAAFVNELPVHSALTHAPDALADLIANDAERVLGPAMASLLVGTDANASDGLLGTLAHQMATGRKANNQAIADMATYVSQQLDASVNTTGPVQVSLLHGLGIGNGVPELLADISSRLDTAISAIDELAGDNGIINNSGRTVNLIEKLTHAVPLPNEVQVALGDLNGLYSQYAEPTMKALQKVLLEMRARLVEIQTGLGNGGQVSAEVKAYAAQYENALRAALNDARDVIVTEVQAALDNGGIDDRTEAEWQVLMQSELTAAVLSNSGYVQAVQDMLRNRLQVVESALRECFDQWLAALNDTLREAISRTLAQIDQKINALTGFSLLKGGQFDGYAHINGDSLTELRINAKLGMSVPDAMEFKGYLLIKDLLATGSGGCYNGSVTSAYLIELGALDVPLAMASAGAHADIAARFAFIGIGDATPLPRSFGGSFEMRGKLEFASFGVKDLKAAMMFTLPIGQKGQPSYFGGENYISGYANVDIGGDGLAGGVFFGRACSNKPIELWDPLVGNLLGNRVLEGVYVYGEGRLPILDFGCPLNLSAGVGAGLFIFADGPEVGGRYHLEIKGEALCTVSVKGEVDLAASATIPLSLLQRVQDGDIDIGASVNDLIGAAKGLRASGRARIKGKAGPCPFCVRFKKSLTFTYKDRKFSADY